MDSAEYLRQLRALHQLNAAQSMLHIFPNIERQGAFCVQVLKDVPGVQTCSVCANTSLHPIGDRTSAAESLCELLAKSLPGKRNTSISPPTGEGLHFFYFQTMSFFFGYILITVSSENDFKLYQPAISNFINTAAVHLENRIRTNEIREQNEHLEELVGKRTAELTAAITERLRILELFQISEMQFRVIYESSPIAIALYDTKCLLIEANKSCLEMFGLRDSSAIRGFNLFDDPNLDIAAKDAIRRGEMVQQELDFDFEKVHFWKLYETKRHGIMHLDLLITPLSGGGEFSGIGYLVHMRDITERKESEESLRVMNEELTHSKEMLEKNLLEKNLLIEELTLTKEILEKTNSTKDKFFSILAHDLRSPFQGFLAGTEMLKEGVGDFSPADLSFFAGKMHSNAKNLYVLLENLLQWAQMQRGTFEFAPEKLQLEEIAKQCILTIMPAAMEKNVNILNMIDNFKVLGDEKMLNSVFRNLLSNGIKFSQKGGRIVLRAQETTEGMVIVSVTDNGIGMPEALVQKLFKLQEKVGRMGTAGEESTGLGLLLCKEFIEKQGGRIWVESIVQKGSTFYFTLPGYHPAATS